jgi:hypothetical protein
MDAARAGAADDVVSTVKADAVGCDDDVALEISWKGEDLPFPVEN